MIRASWTLGLLITLAVIPAGAATPSDELLRLLPKEPGFCFVVRDLRGHNERVANSPFMLHFKTSPVGKLILGSKVFAEFQDFDKKLQQHFKADIARIRDEVLGDGFVFAYWPGAPGAAAGDMSLFLLRAPAKDPQLLKQFVDGINEMEKQAKRLDRVEPVEHMGQTYHRQSNGGRVVGYYWLRNNLLAVSEQEAAIQHAIAAELKPPADNPVFAKMTELGVADALLVFWINPRAFDAHYEHNAATAAEPEKTFLKALREYWTQLQGLALAIRLHDELEVSLVVGVNTEGLPKAAQRFFATAAQSSRVWQHFPERTMLAVAGRLDFVALMEMVSAFIPAENRGELGKGIEYIDRMSKATFQRSFTKDILPNLGPDWGFYVAAPEPLSDPPAVEMAPWFPHILFALQVRSDPNETQPLDFVLATAIRTLAGALSIGMQSEGVELHTEQQGTVPVIWLSSVKHFPPGFQPAFAAKASHLVLASSPAAIRSFANRGTRRPLLLNSGLLLTRSLGALRSGSPRLPGRPEVRAVGQRARGDSGILLARISFQEIQAYLRHYRAPILRSLAQVRNIPAKDAETHLDGVIAMLDLFERADLTLRTSNNRAELTFHFKPTKSLRK